MTILRELCDDEHGFIISTELVVIATLLVVGLITGIQCVQSAVIGEMNDVAAAIGSLNQSYGFTGKHGCWSWCCGRTSWTAGSSFVDCVDEIREPIDFGWGYIGPHPPAAPPMIAHPPMVLPPLESPSYACPCVPAIDSACPCPASATDLPIDCPQNVPCPSSTVCPGTAPACPVIW